MTHKNARNLVALSAIANFGVAIANVSVPNLVVALALAAVFFLVGDE